ncbi:MAG: nuclear transport factor 2 family protein [Pseudomonadota bacterium]
MSLKPVLIALAGSVLLPACVAEPGTRLPVPIEVDAEETRAVLAVLMDQQTAWNEGDIDRFMQGYWQSPDLRFASGGSVTRGWQQTRDRYKARYTDRKIMGELTFSDLDVDLISSDAAIVHGAWALTRESDRPSGLFTLVFKRFETGWKIVSDTTTSAD